MKTIIPLQPTRRRTAFLDLRPLAWALSRLAPGLWAEQLPGESPAEAAARHAAAADIIDDLLDEYATQVEAVEGVAA